MSPRETKFRQNDKRDYTDRSDNLCRYWSAKEAFVKAIGDGVGYKLDTIEFHHENWENIIVKVDGKELKDWRFWLLELGKDHLVSSSIVLIPI